MGRRTSHRTEVAERRLPQRGDRTDAIVCVRRWRPSAYRGRRFRRRSRAVAYHAAQFWVGRQRGTVGTRGSI